MRVLRFKHTFFMFAGLSGTFQAVLNFLLFPSCLTQSFRASPLFQNTPYLWVWNAPTEDCGRKFNVPLDMSLFTLTGNPQKSLTGQGITIFYADRLGYYPYIDRVTLKSINGGIPQMGSLKKHLDKAKDDIIYYIPTDNVGLAIIDWEDWKPLWERNWKPKDIYRRRSVELVLQQNAQLDVLRATKLAKAEFEQAAKNFMQATLKLGKLLRPNFLWGYYLFPDCYNHLYNQPNYDGSCLELEKKNNDELNWLWKESTALYPTIYLSTKLNSTNQALLFARNRVQEALRVSKVRDIKNPLPVYMYTRPVYTETSGEYLTLIDLVHTVGESIALGASGVILWGSLDLSENRQTCMNLDNYMKTILLPYIINVTLAAKMCSQVLCQDEGVCIRKYWNTNDYLHLNPMNFAIQTGQGGKYIVFGKPTFNDLRHFSDNFYCNCYSNSSCLEAHDMQSVETIKVCVAEDVCIDAHLSTEMSDLPSSFTETPSHKESHSTEANTVTPWKRHE